MALLHDRLIQFPRKDFPRLTHFGVLHNRRAEDTGLHVHSGFEIFFFIDGTGSLTLSRGKDPIEIRRNLVVIIAPGYTHAFKTVTRAVSHYWLGIETEQEHRNKERHYTGPETFKSYDQARIDTGYIRHIDGNTGELAESLKIDGYAALYDMPRVGYVFDDIEYEIFYNRIHSRVMIYLKALELLTLVSRKLTPSGRIDISARVREVYEYLRAHYKQKVISQDLAALSGYSPVHLNRIFKQAYGVTPSKMLNQLRIDRAVQLLEGGESVTDAALQSGFCNVYHFSAMFKKVTGETPSEVRKAAKG